MDQVGDRTDLEIVERRERDQIRKPRHGPVLIHHFADHACGDQPREARNIHCRLRILHKTEVGGVKLAIDSPEEATTEAAAMAIRVRSALPEARLEGFLLSEMAPAGVELILGTRRDSLFGPLVLVGLGGVTAELFEDVVIRLAPVDRQEAEAMLHELKCWPLLDGWRGAPKADVAAAADAIAALSALAVANVDTVDTLEINPLRILPAGRGAVALDAVIETGAPA